jgi:hypothetical protein
MGAVPKGRQTTTEMVLPAADPPEPYPRSVNSPFQLFDPEVVPGFIRHEP